MAPLETILNSFPADVIQHFGRERLLQVLKDYRQVMYRQKPYYDAQKPMPSHYTPEQLNVIVDFKQLRQEFKAAFPLQFYFKTPLHYLKETVVHSNTSHLFLFQEPFRHLLGLNLFRYFLLALHMALYASLFFQLTFFRKQLSNIPRFATFVGVPLLALLFFVLVHQEIEQRYMLPFLPLILLGAGYFPEIFSPGMRQKLKISSIGTESNG